MDTSEAETAISGDAAEGFWKEKGDCNGGKRRKDEEKNKDGPSSCQLAMFHPSRGLNPPKAEKIGQNASKYRTDSYTEIPD